MKSNMTEPKAREWLDEYKDRKSEAWIGDLDDYFKALQAANAKIAELQSQVDVLSYRPQSELMKRIKGLEAVARAELMEGQEPSDRAQEAAHYNWLDDQNEKLRAKLERAKLGLKFYADEKDWCTSTVSFDPESSLIQYFMEENGGQKARECLADLERDDLAITNKKFKEMGK